MGDRPLPASTSTCSLLPLHPPFSKVPNFPVRFPCSLPSLHHLSEGLATAVLCVALTWRTMSTTEEIEGILEVNGAAIDASPSFTTGTTSTLPSSPVKAARPSRGF